MAITRPLSIVTGGVINGASVTLNFPANVLQNDVAVLIGSRPRSATTSGPWGPISPSTGWTQVVVGGSVSSAADQWLGVWWKRMGSTPDTTVVCAGGGNAADSNSYQLWILRGVDQTTAVDVASPAAALNTLDPPSITTVTNGAWVFAAAAATVNDTAVSGFPTGYSDGTRSSMNDTRNTTVVVARKEVAVAGVENPSAYTDLTAGVNPVSVVAAFRPAGGGTENLSGGGSTSVEVQAVGGGGGAAEAVNQGGSTTLQTEATGGGASAETISRGGDTTVEVQAVGGGIGVEGDLRSGGGDTTAQTQAVGGGVGTEAVSRGGDTTFQVQASGGGVGTETISRGGDTTFQTQAEGGGVASEGATRPGPTRAETQSVGGGVGSEDAVAGGSTSVEVQAVGGGIDSTPAAGEENLAGGGIAPVRTQAVGDGVGAESAAGGGEAGVEVTAEGGGFATQTQSLTRSGNAPVRVQAVGDGVGGEFGVGGGVATITVATEGGGYPEIREPAPVLVNPRATLGGTQPTAGIVGGSADAGIQYSGIKANIVDSPDRAAIQ